MLPSIPLLSLSLLCLCISWAVAAPSYSPIWHKQLLGPPTIRPEIHRVPGANKTVVILGNGKTVAGVNPGNGDIVWRQLHDPLEPVIRHASSGKLTATLSGPSGSHLRLYTPHTGELVREFLLHRPEAGRLYAPAELGTGLEFVQETGELVVLSNGNTVRLVGSDGLRWTWTSEDEGADRSYYSLFVEAPSYVHLLGVDLSTSKRVHTVLSLSSGSPLLTSPLPFPEHIASDPIVLHPGVVLELQDGKLLSAPLSAEYGKKLKVHTHAGKWQKLVPVGLHTAGLVVAIRDDGAAEVLRAKPDGSVERAWEFSDSKTSAHYSESIFAGAVDKNGAPHVARLYWTHSLHMASIHVYSAKSLDGQGMTSGFTFPFATKTHGTMKDFALEIGLSGPTPQSQKVIPRFVLLSSTGAVQLWQDDKLMWTREEGLGDLVGGVAWADREHELPSVQKGDKTIADQEGLIRKWERHAGLIWRLPGYIVSFVLRFFDSASQSAPTSQLSHALSKLALVASSSGKIFALDTLSGGNVVWERILGISGAPEGVGKVDVQKVLSVGGVGWVVLGYRTDEDGVKTVGWQIVPETGKIHPPPGREGTTNGLTIFSGRMLEAFVLPADGTSTNETVVLVSEDRSVHVFPDDASRIASLSHRAPTLYFSLPFTHPDLSLERASLEGYAIVPESSSFLALPTFSAHLSPSPKSSILSLVRPQRGPIASLGRVMGNKKTLYKYLNPHLVVALTEFLSVSGSGEERCGIHVVDEVSGTVVYDASVRRPAGRPCEISAVLVDNWLVWHFWNDGDSGTAVVGGGMRTKGWRVVVVEMYEGEPDEVTRSLELSSLAVNSTKVHTISQSYGFPSAWNAVTTTSTKYGITLKDIIIANDRLQIKAYPHALLDPRRPAGKLSSEDKEEMLLPFDSVIPDESRRTVSHNLQVLGINQLSTTPTALESTSLLLASGLDLFVARLSPSSTFDILSDSFNKLQLVLTTIGLLAGIAIVKPIVDRKKIQQRWYSTT